MSSAQYRCLNCGHSFKTAVSAEVCCPRCGSSWLEANLYLLGSAKTPEAEEDYFDIALGPCCQPGGLGWECYKNNIKQLPAKADKP